MRRGVAAFAAWASLTCGYQPIHDGPVRERLCVLAAPSQIPDFGAVHAALDGARAELARFGALAPEGRHPCLVVELLRVDEQPIGIAFDGDQPRARGSAVAVRGRAWVQVSAGAPELSRDTGDVRRVVRLETAATLPANAARNRRGAHAAAEALGRDLALRVLGLPVPASE